MLTFVPGWLLLLQLRYSCPQPSPAQPRRATSPPPGAVPHPPLQFDRERIPERVVHARGASAKGFFEVTHDVSHLTCADFLRAPGVQVRQQQGRVPAGLS